MGFYYIFWQAHPDYMSQVSPQERLSRFLIDKRHIRTSNNSVRFNAFLPPKSGKLSVYRTSEQSESVIWNIGQVFVATPRQKPLIGRADLAVETVTSEGLSVVPEPTPHPLHADIVGWMQDSSHDRLTALKLAAMAAVVLKN